jgi:Tfp pilus assembly protein PilO
MNFLIRLADLSIPRCVIGSAIIGALYYTVGYDSGLKFKTEIAATSAKATKVEEEYTKLDRSLKEILVLKDAQARDASRLDALMAFIPEKLTKTDMMRTLSNEAKAVGISINQIKDSLAERGKKSDSVEFYEEIAVDLDLVGGFSQLVLYLANLTRLNQIFSVKNLELTSTSKDELKMSSKIIGYRYLGAEVVAKLEADRKSKLTPKKKGATKK